MSITDTCPDCGAERPSWLGSSHHKSRIEGRERIDRPVCTDDRTPDEYFSFWNPPGWP